MMTTKERFLTTAISLFSKQGYHATGLNEIVAVSGAPKGSLYHHFPGGKEQLALDAIRSERAFVHRAIEESLQKSDSPVVAIQTFILELANQYSLQFQGLAEEEAHLSMGLLALESASLSERLRQACVEAFQDWIDLYVAKLRQDGFDEVASLELGLLVQTMVEGASLLCVTRKDTRPLLNLMAQIPVILKQKT